MSMHNPYSKHATHYQKQAIETASQEEILLMLYDGAIRFLLISKKAHEAQDWEKYNRHLLKTQNIILEFMNSLDLEMAGEVGRNLYNLYEYFHYQLVQANIKKDLALVDEVLTHLRGLKATWSEAIRIAQQEDGFYHERHAAGHV